jgi:hypothetical protein
MQKSWLLRAAGAGQEINGLHHAKVPCEISYLCDKFRTHLGANMKSKSVPAHGKRHCATTNGFIGEAVWFSNVRQVAR